MHLSGRCLLLCPSVAMLAFVAAACGGGGGGGPTPPPPPTITLGSITVTPSPLALTAGQVRTLAAQALDVNGAAIANATGFTFSSGNGSIVTVLNTGSAIGLTAGVTQITVSLTLNGVTKTATVDATVVGTLPASAAVVINDVTNVFQPPLTAITRTGTVTWTFGAGLHNVEFTATPGSPANVGSVINTTVVRTFNTAGAFQYNCSLHNGMSGIVFVQ